MDIFYKLTLLLFVVQ